MSYRCHVFLFILFILFLQNFDEPTGRETGKGTDMENQNLGTAAQGAEGANKTNEGAEGAKLFTQDEVNRIIGERLARVRSAQEGAESSEREQSLDQREIRLDARERLADLGISKDLLPLVNCSSKETMKESIDLIAAQFEKKSKPENSYRIVTGVSNSGNGAGRKAGASDDEIRAAMGLKRSR